MPNFTSTKPASYRQPSSLETASLNWQAATPFADDFDDVYFSRDQGPAESDYVFLEQNFLPERWLNWSQDRAFVMAETGFGTGLNLLVAMSSFLKTAPDEARLHWISTELYPLTPEDLQHAHTFWPEFTELAQLLQQNYPLAISGFHRLNLHPRITVDLLLGDAGSNLSSLAGKVDTWCLDGFAPSKNPSMWTPELFMAIAKASQAGTTFATFTAAGVVKRGLQSAGFTVNKVKGFGSKREMLSGVFTTPKPSSNSSSNNKQPIAIIGAGLAGLATAQALIKRGYQVDLYEEKTIGAGGSGNKQGALYIKLAVDTNLPSQFYLAGLEYSRRWLQDLDPEQQLWSPTGVLQLATTSRELQRQQRFLKQQCLPKTLVTAVDNIQAQKLAGSEISSGGLFFPRAGWVKTLAVCKHLAKTLTNLNLYENQAVTNLTPANTANKDWSWQVTTASGSKTYKQVVICCAEAATKFIPSQWLPVKAVRGQVSYLSFEQQSLQQPSSKPMLPNTLVCGRGYAIPPANNNLCFGATFDTEDTSLTVSQTGQLQNLQELNDILPNLLAELPADYILNGRVSFRCASPDYLPLVGRLPAIEKWQNNYSSAQSSFTISDFPSEWNYAGLWLNIGHGSRGLASIPLSSELLASQLIGDPAPFEQELVNCLNPARFILKDLKRL